ncbi:MAG: hypothetical protein JST11_28240 [Acidobacteria bacterium]|nr:hypothetical protein [Acidobacteriota bacterium]
MTRKLQPFVLAFALALCLVRAAAAPPAGIWDGTVNGAKAATVTIAEKDGVLRGSAVFYIIRDNGNGAHNGDPQPAQEMKSVEWDGQTLRFTVADSNGAPAGFVMRLTGEGTAELRARSGKPDVIAQMRRRP